MLKILSPFLGSALILITAMNSLTNFYSTTLPNDLTPFNLPAPALIIPKTTLTSNKKIIPMSVNGWGILVLITLKLSLCSTTYTKANGGSFTTSSALRLNSSRKKELALKLLNAMINLKRLIKDSWNLNLSPKQPNENSKNNLILLILLNSEMPSKSKSTKSLKPSQKMLSCGNIIFEALLFQNFSPG